MGFLIRLICWMACVHVVYLYPFQDESSGLFNENLRLAKKDPFYPFKESIWSSLGYLENPRAGTQSQRKKAVDSTFIRFGRSSSSSKQETSGDGSLERPPFPDYKPELELSRVQPQRLMLSRSGCRIGNSRELVQALMNERDCIRAYQKVKRENVNDTFMGFGKREVNPEEEFESSNQGAHAR